MPTPRDELLELTVHELGDLALELRAELGRASSADAGAGRSRRGDAENAADRQAAPTSAG
ncbi:MAG: hypothetical protein M3619_00525 [Myxococcota bacterium]|nr:hypothetical protein [Myxococcota bacterium]